MTGVWETADETLPKEGQEEDGEDPQIEEKLKREWQSHSFPTDANTKLQNE